ncbi:MAG: hypothetical protein AB7V16_12745 [Vulcanibacillus sp.]
METEKFAYSSIIFDSKPDAVPFNYRLSYKIGQLCLIISSNTRGGTSLYKIHMLSIAMFSEEEKQKLFTFCNFSDPFFVIRFDPSVNRTILFALFDGLIIQQNNGLFKLTEKGKLLSGLIKEDLNVFIGEKLFLQDISNTLTEAKIKNLKTKWGGINVTS